MLALIENESNYDQVYYAHDNKDNLEAYTVGHEKDNGMQEESQKEETATPVTEEVISLNTKTSLTVFEGPCATLRKKAQSTVTTSSLG